MSGHLSRDNSDTRHVTKGHDNPPSLEGVMSCHRSCHRRVSLSSVQRLKVQVIHTNNLPSRA